MQKEEGNVIMPEWVSNWELPSDEYEMYRKTYERYQNSLENINKAHNEVVQSKQALEKVKSLSEELSVAVKIRDEYKKSFAEESKTKSVENELKKRTGNIVDFEGKYTSLKAYNDERNSIIKKYDTLREEYISRKRSELDSKKQSCIEELEKFNEDRPNYIKKQKEKIHPDCNKVVEAKKNEIIDYLTCSSQIKNTSSAKNIMASIKNEKPNKAHSGSSELELLNQVMDLEGAKQYARKNNVTFEDLSKSGTTKGSAFPLLCGLGIAMILCFIFVISPFDTLMTASSIAGATQSVTQVIVNILLALLGGLIFAGVVYAGFALFGLNIVGAVLGLIGGVYLGYKIFTKYHPIIQESIFMGAGGVIHNIIVWILQIIIIIVVLGFVWLIIVHTPLINLIYAPNNNKVLSDLNVFEEYFNNHKMEFVALFNIDDAMSYACENRLTYELMEVENAINKIEQDSEVIGIIDKSKRELGALEKRRNLEIQNEEIVKKENDKKIQTIRHDLEQKEFDRVLDVQKKMQSLKNDVENKRNSLEAYVVQKTGTSHFDHKVSAIDFMDAYVKEKVENEKNLIEQSETDKKYLNELTIKFMGDMDLKKVDSARTVYKTNANLPEYIYFVKPKKDKNDMAVVEKINLKCIPIIGVYDYKDLQGDNLSDELSHFIEWLCVSIRNVTAQSIMGGITVVDTVSGNSTLKTERFHGFLKVKDDASGINALTIQLYEKERMIADRVKSIGFQAKEMGLGEQIGDIGSIDSLNRAIMMIDQEEIFEDPDKPVEGEDGLWEQPVKYNFVIFVIPSARQKSVGQSVLTDELKKCLTSCSREGIIPVFLVDSDNWERPDMSDDISWIKGLREKMMWHIANIGKSRKELLEITAI